MESMPRIPDDADTTMALKIIEQSEHPVLPATGFMLKSVPSLLNTYMGKHNLSTDVLFESVGLNRATGYRIMNGQRRASRDVLISLALELALDYEQTQQLLKVGRWAPLSPRDVRDGLILHGVTHKKGLGDTDVILSDAGLEPLVKPIQVSAD